MSWTQKSGEWLAAKVGRATRFELEERIAELEEENGRLTDRVASPHRQEVADLRTIDRLHRELGPR